MFSVKTKWYIIASSWEELLNKFENKNQFIMVLPFGSVIFVKKEEAIFAFKNRCPHQNKSLLGCTIDEKLECPWHKYRFDLQTGRGHGMALDKYEIQIKENNVLLGREYFSFF